jgi:hypothetical protein
MTYPPNMDPTCIPLCDELNALPGLRTFESCEGHGKHPFRIFFTAEKIESLAPLLETLSNGWPWLVEAGWGNGAGRVYFMLEGPCGDGTAWQMFADQLREDRGVKRAVG